VIYAHARNLISGFFTNLLKVHLNVGLRRNVRVLQELGVAESISGDKFVSGSRINAPTAHAQISSSQKSPKMVSHAGNDRVFIGKWVH